MKENESASGQDTGTQDKQDPTGINPELVEAVEGSKIDIGDKVNLLLVGAGMKPASNFELLVRSGENVFLGKGDLEKIKSIMNESGLVFEVHEIENDIESKMQILFGRSREELERLAEIVKNLPNPKQVESGEYSKDQMREIYLAQGAAYGYPQSAIEAFVGKGGGERLNVGDLPAEIRESDAFIFSVFALSKDNWQEEIKQGKAWADYIKSVSPGIYREMMEKSRKTRGLRIKINKEGR